MIGIAMPSFTFKQELERYYEKDSILNQYKPLAQKYKVDLSMFSFRQIRPEQELAEALVYSYSKNAVMKKAVPIPHVNIVRNTGYVVNHKLIDQFETLRRQNIHLINFPLYRQANKYQNYEYLSSFDQLKRHVPDTGLLTYEYLELFIQQYEKVIIKPVYGSKGRGITVLEKKQNHYKVHQTTTRKKVYDKTERNLDQKTFSIPHSGLRSFYDETYRKPSSFLVQQWIQFKQLNGRPFDIRAVVQKNGQNRWQVTSRVARVANKDGQITNLHQGGEMFSLSQLNLKKYYRVIRQFSLGLAKAFAKLYPWTAEMGIDLAIDQRGKPWYIETNFCPEKLRWATIFKIPFEYAYYLYKQ